jgi:hypothetical protein
MNFLLNYSNPNLESVSDAFVLSEAHAEPPEELREDSFTEHNLLDENCVAELFPGIYLDIYMGHDAEPTDFVPSSSRCPTSPEAQPRIDMLLSLLISQYQSSPKQYPLLTDQTALQLANTVFTSDNISEYVSAFFNFFHPPTPFIHRPSFKVESAPLHLLLPDLLVGSIFCTPQDHALSARWFFGIAEEYVFGLLREVITNKVYSRVESITIVQAAVLIHALQVNSDHEGVRHRVRVNRFPEIVASLRFLGLFGVVRTPQLEQADWTRYIMDEAQIRYVLHTSSLVKMV